MNDHSENNEPRRFGPIPVAEGQEYDVTIEGIGEKGDGIAKIQGYVVVVPKTEKGQRVRIRVNAVRGKVSFGEVIEVLQDESDDDPQMGDEDEVDKIVKPKKGR